MNRVEPADRSPEGDLSGSYEMFRSENFAAFLVACGAPPEVAAAIERASCVQHVEEHEDRVGVKIDSDHPFLDTPGMKTFMLGRDWEEMQDMHGKPVRYRSTRTAQGILHEFEDEERNVLSSLRVKTEIGMNLVLEKFGVRTTHYFRSLP